jgi:hypothetical protein
LSYFRLKVKNPENPKQFRKITKNSRNLLRIQNHKFTVPLLCLDLCFDEFWRVLISLIDFLSLVMDRLRRHIPLMLKRALVELNLFESDWTDSNNQSQIRYQRMATRLYIVLVTLGLIIYTLYLFLTPQIHVEVEKDPSPAQFSRLHSLYPSSLQCNCSNISVPYHVFLTIEPHYHQICSSDLVSDRWINCLGLYYFVSHDRLMGSDDEIDNRRYGSSQFVLLKILCDQAKQTIMNSLQQFLNQTLVTTHVISENLFEFQAITLIEDWKVITINNFLRTLQLIRVTQHGNHLAAAHTNLRFDVSRASNQLRVNSSVNYSHCNCMLSASCHSPMGLFRTTGFYDDFQSHIPGFFGGCFRLEALLNSTLECFYNQTCMDQMYAETQSWLGEANSTALNATRNSPNESIYSVVKQLFVDDWSQNNG